LSSHVFFDAEAFPNVWVVRKGGHITAGFQPDGLASEIRRDDRFLYDSPLEGSGFEPSVPLGEKRSFRNASIRELHRAAYGAAANDIGADDRQAAGDQIIANTATASELQVSPVG
jgi:hypothetical protein